MHQAEPFVAAAARSSRRLGHDYIGTEHVLLALAEDVKGAPAQALTRLGISDHQIHADIVEMIGRCDRPRRVLDPDALATLGIDLDQVRRHVDHSFGPDALERTWAGGTPLAPRLKRALEQSAREAGDSAMRPEHVLLGLAGVECVAAELLARHGITADDVRTALGHLPSDQGTD